MILTCFPKNRYLCRIPMKRTIVYWGVSWGSPFFGKLPPIGMARLNGASLDGEG